MCNLAYISLALIAISIYSCDKVDNPLISKGTGTIPVVKPTHVDSTMSTSADDNMRKILIEDYTGHMCINCPTAAAQCDLLVQTDAHKSEALLVEINASGLADSNNNVPGSPPGAFGVNYLTTAGTDWFNQFINVAVPGTMVDRLYYTTAGSGSGDLYLNGINVNIPFDSLDTTPQSASIHIVDSLYTPPTKAVSMTVTTKILSPQAGTKYFLVVMLVEDSICDYQDSLNSVVNAHYIHRMVMRTVINGNSGAGDSLISNTTAAQAKHYAFTSSRFAYNPAPVNPYAPAVPLTSWNMGHMYVVAFVYQTTSGSHNQMVLQAQRLHL